MCTQLPILDRIAAAANAGFKGVNLHRPYVGPAQDLTAACTAHDLTLLALSTAKGAGQMTCVWPRLLGAKLKLSQLSGSRTSASRYSWATRSVSWPGTAPIQSPTRRQFQQYCALRRMRPWTRCECWNRSTPRDDLEYCYHRITRATEITVAAGRPNWRILYGLHHFGFEQGNVPTGMTHLMPPIGRVRSAAVLSRG